MNVARRALPALAPALLLIVGITSSSAAQDPPERVGRLSFISGPVSLRPGGLDDWDNAPLNYPLTTGDDLWSDVGGRVEITLGPTTLRLAPSTDFGFLALEDQFTQLRLTQGSLQIHVRYLADDETFEIDTPNGAVSLLVPGTYRVDVNATGNATTVTVREGEADLIAGGSWFSVDAGETATLAGLDAPYYDVRVPRPPDTWESWGMGRDRRRDESPSARWVSPDMPGYEDLDEYGVWSVSAEYGPVWTPRRVTSGWAPYRNGHWAWVDPWGWTWIDDLPWGFAPYHYGRWVQTGRGWAWVPGRVVARPVYAPALVAFVGGSNWSISAGVGGGVGWFPLGPGEAYYPMYRVSDRYLRNINSTTVNVTSLTLADMTSIRYRNRAAPGGITVVTRETFVGGRPVGRSLIVVPRNRLNSAPIVGTAAPFAPNRQSVLRPSGRPVRLPPENNVTRRLVVRRTPPAPPMSFSVRERALQRNPGRPLDEATLAALRDRNPPPQHRPVRSATRGGGPDLRPARRGLPEPRPVTPDDHRRWSDNAPDRDQRGRGNDQYDRDNRGRQRGRDDRGRDDRQESEQPAPPPSNDRGRRPVDRPADPPLPTPPMLPAEPAPPANPPPPPPRQERGRRPDTGRPQPEPRPPAPPATPEQPKATEPVAPLPPPPSPPQDRGRRSGGGQPQAEPRPPAAAVGTNPMTSVAISGPTSVHADQVCRWTATPTGGIGPYTYRWMSGSVVDNTSGPSTYGVSVLDSFSVTVSVTSADGGQASASLQVTVEDGGAGC